MKSKSLRNLRIMAVAYSALYITGIVISIYKGELSFQKIIDISFLFLFILFLSGNTFLWRRVRVTALFIWKRDFQAGWIFVLCYKSI